MLFLCMAGQNPYDNYLSKEQVMQAEIARLLSLKHPDLFWWHTVNEGKRTPYEQYLFKKMGGMKGVADFVILEQGSFSKGLMMEIKWGKGVCTVDQVDFLIRSAKKGFTAAVVYDDARDALDLVDRYLKSGVIYPSDGILLVKKGKYETIPFDHAHRELCKKTKQEALQEKVVKLFNARYAKKLAAAGKLFSGKKIEQ